MSGKILHTWTAKKNYWQHVEMCDNGDLLAICWNHWITKVDWNSNLKWIIKMHVHHDLAIAQNKDIYTIVKKKEIVFEHGLPVPIYNDYIVIISADGKIKKSISLYKILKEKIPPDKFVQAYRWSQQEMIKFNSPLPMHYNILYINTLEIIKQDIKGLCKQGDLLICARNLNLIGIVDIKNERLLWSWGQEDLDYPHYPTLIENNNILIFDNGYQRGYSRIVELNPLTKNIVWEYRTNPPSRFFSKNRGSNQKLPNGNILITESDNGRAFEITQDGEIVWEFYSPQIRIATKERQALYRVMRITNPENYSFLKGLK
ncbi:MAG TPA: arylsulfotransferase family protein [Candidatus Omnitrophota bacterium]|nr:arylsulfotransferase family protein [Candidatus Omnitrophota bacterium]HPT39930.1 arylsulfotransferase family protein [Candidatus Omnitrophota bacterium]